MEELRGLAVVEQHDLGLVVARAKAAIKGNVHQPLAEVGLGDTTSQHAFKVDYQVEGDVIDEISIDDDDILAPIDGIDSLLFHWHKDTVFSLVGQTFPCFSFGSSDKWSDWGVLIIACYCPNFSFSFSASTGGILSSAGLTSVGSDFTSTGLVSTLGGGGLDLGGGVLVLGGLDLDFSQF